MLESSPHLVPVKLPDLSNPLWFRNEAGAGEMAQLLKAVLTTKNIEMRLND